jgi:TonB family protein
MTTFFADTTSLRTAFESWLTSNFLLWHVQNTLFISLVLLLCMMLRERNAAMLRAFTLIGLIKLFILPFLSPPDTLPTLAPIALSLSPVELQAESPQTAEPLSPTLLFGAVWLVGAGLVLLMSLVQTLLLHRRFRRAVFVFERNGIGCYQSSEQHSPFVLGLFRPRIVLPAQFSMWSSNAREATLEHELAHIRHHDQWIRVIQLLATAIHWFNPVVWILNKHLSRYSEMMCDDAAVSAAQLNPDAYSRELVAVAEAVCTHRNAVYPLAFSESFRSLKARLIYQQSNKETLKMRKMIFALLLLALLPLAWQCTDRSASEQTALPVSPKEATAPSPDPPEYVEVDKEPSVINYVKPVYPEVARAEKVEARVVVKALIDEQGHATKISVIKISAGNKPLDERFVKAFSDAAMSAVSAMTFSPAEKDGKAVKCWMVFPMRFSLNSKPSSVPSELRTF